jgi:hypothetical protein
MLCVALGAILPWVKREGAILWVVTMLCALFAIWNRRNLRSALFSLLPGIGLIAAWKTFESSVHVLRPPGFLPVSAEFFLADFKRMSGIGHKLYLELCDTSRWNTFLGACCARHIVDPRARTNRARFHPHSSADRAARVLLRELHFQHMAVVQRTHRTIAAASIDSVGADRLVADCARVAIDIYLASAACAAARRAIGIRNGLQLT